MAIKVKLVLLCLLGTVVSYNSGQPLIVLETESINQTSASFTSCYNDTRQDRNKQLLLLDGEDCSENSVSGSLLVSTVKNIGKLNISPSSSQLKADHIAIICTKCFQECAILHSLVQRKKNVSSVMLLLSSNNYNGIPEAIYFMPPTYFLIDAFLRLSQSLHWNRLGLIVDHSNVYYSRLEKYFVNKFRKFVIIHPVISVLSTMGQINLMIIVQQVEESGAKVLVLLTQEAPKILCAAHHRGMVWPHYGWLLYGSSSPDIKQLPTCRGSHHYLEGTVFPTYYSSLATKASLEESAIQLVSKASTAATQLHIDLKSALLRMTIPGIQKNITFLNIQQDIPAVYFIQVRNGTARSVATVHNDTVLVNRWLQEEELPRGTLPVRVNTVYPTWLGALEITVSGTLITITLVLYVYYRKEPEVRATSWTLSLLMLMGCYLLAAYLVLLTLHTAVQPIHGFNLCVALVWTSGIGLSYPLILAVLLVKLARVYRIFYHYSQIGKFCSDVALAVYVLLLLSPIIIILTVMTVLQQYNRYTGRYLYKDHIELLSGCYGDLELYFIALACYVFLFIVCIIIAALKTRKLRHRNFRDAKKINIFLVLILLTGVFELVLYQILTELLLTYISLHVAHCILISLCLGFLFLPKLFPIIYRKFPKYMTRS